MINYRLPFLKDFRLTGVIVSENGYLECSTILFRAVHTLITTAGRQQTCLPRWRKELAARIKGDVLSRLYGALFSLKFLVMNSWSIFMSPFHARQLILPCTWRGHVIFLGKFLQTRSVDQIAIGLLKKANCNKFSSKSGL